MDDNIALLLLASCRTRHIRAKWFRRVPRLCVCLHKRQYANGRLLLQAPCPFHRLVESYLGGRWVKDQQVFIGALSDHIFMISWDEPTGTAVSLAADTAR